MERIAAQRGQKAIHLPTNNMLSSKTRVHQQELRIKIGMPLAGQTNMSDQKIIGKSQGNHRNDSTKFIVIISLKSPGNYSGPF